MQDRADRTSGNSPLMNERELLVVRPAMFRGKPFRFTVLMLVMIGCGVAALWMLFTPLFWAAILLGIAAVAAAATLAAWKIWTWTIVLRITNERTIEDRGFFSRRTSEVMHHNIRNVVITQSFWNRIWRVGQIQIASAGHEGYEITFRDATRPDNIKRLIDEYRDYGGDDGE